ncbi:MAG: DUF1501 domain-containing protein [Planctomycetaceae bacterium]|nr:DUF1501 domain-containing protein [Planctomycetaceae bacterium]
MLTVAGSPSAYCDRVSRRGFLRIGGLQACGLGLAGLSLPELLRNRAAAGTAARSPKAVIMVCLPGGPSHHDTYDMKPDAPANIRGEFRPTATNVPGFDLCELMPRQAAMADKFALVRSMTFRQPDHQLHEVFTGFPLAAGRPAFGSVVSRLREAERARLPKYFSLGYFDHPRTVAKAEQPLYAGAGHAPFAPTGTGLATLTLPGELPPLRFDSRVELARQFDGLRREIDRRPELAAGDAYRSQALDMITSPLLRDALDLSKESAATRGLYGPDVTFQHNYQFGHTWHASNFLLARRLVEAGVPVVTVSEGGWDHHGNVSGVRGTIFERSREQLPVYDRSLAALVTDLHERGLDRDVAVVVWGEFGRTPVINVNGGRDHFTRAGFALFAGGGFRTGQVIGATDQFGAAPTTRPYSPPNVLATLYRHLGIDPATKLIDGGRPIGIVDDAEPIAELL